jgi:hypothetical protein
MKLFQAVLASAAFVSIGALSRADPAPMIHYAPAENLEHIDVELIDSATQEIEPPPYVPPIPLEVWIAFGPIAAGGLLILVLYILKNMRGK